MYKPQQQQKCAQVWTKKTFNLFYKPKTKAGAAATDFFLPPPINFLPLPLPPDLSALEGPDLPKTLGFLALPFFTFLPKPVSTVSLFSLVALRRCSSFLACRSAISSGVGFGFCCFDGNGAPLE